MGCVQTDKNVGNLRALDSVDLQARKRQMLVEYALRNKMQGILEIVNCKMPF